MVAFWSGSSVKEDAVVRNNIQSFGEFWLRKLRMVLEAL